MTPLVPGERHDGANVKDPEGITTKMREAINEISIKYPLVKNIRWYKISSINMPVPVT